MKPKFVVLQKEPADVELVDIRCLSSLTFVAEGKDKSAKVSFEQPIGFRVLDERDLSEFWSAGVSSTEGWLYEITGHGWLAQESERNGFTSHHIFETREFLAIGVDWCISVLSAAEPTVKWV
jgi:hypothetical protein